MHADSNLGMAEKKAKLHANRLYTMHFPLNLRCKRTQCKK